MALSPEKLVWLCDVCQSMHMVMSLGKGFPPGSFISSELNPAELICTCKGYKVSSNCSHTIAVTALFPSLCDYGESNPGPQLSPFLTRICFWQLARIKLGRLR